MSQSMNVKSFLEQLQNATPQPRNDQPRTSVLNKIYLNVPDNFGKYQVFPFISEITGNPYTYLYRTREINLPRKGGAQDRLAWHRILPASAYQFVDSTGRLVPSLTDEEANLLAKAQGTFDILDKIMPDSSGNGQKKSDILRVKDYTIFNAYVLNKYDESELNKPVRSGFAALFVCTSKKFAGEVKKDIQMGMTNYGGTEFIAQVYNREQSHRTGWLIFTIGKETQGFGYRIGISHAANLGENVSGSYVVPDDAMEVLGDPTKNFLGWQAGDSKNLFNRELLEYEIDEMNKLIAKVNSTSVNFASTSIASSQVNAAQRVQPQQLPYTPDPMVAQYQREHQNVAPQERVMQGVGEMRSNNTDVYGNPPASQIDPISGAQVGGGHSYVQPSFASPTPSGASPFDNYPDNPYNGAR